MNSYYFYCETAFHHEGDMAYMKGLIDASNQSGARGVKFQVLTRAEDFISTKHTAFVSLRGFCFNLEQWEEIFSYTIAQGLDIIMMPLNMESFLLTEKFPVKYLDIHSVSFYDTAVLQKVKETRIPVILGVGGRTLDEIIEKKVYYGDQLAVLMTGYQSFPSKIEDVKIGKINFLRNLFPDVQTGYADHSAFDNEYAIKSNEYARLLGATVFEKHITTSEGVERTDFSAAVSSQKITEIIQRLNFIESFILTDFVASFDLTKAETTYRNRQMKCVAANNLVAGTQLSEGDLVLKLVDDPEDTFSKINELVGRTLNKAVASDCTVKGTDLQ